MATIKSFTDLSQSKVLAEFLPIESADCYWEDDISIEFGHGWHPQHIPCWSLSALLDIIPEGVTEKYYAPNIQKENGIYTIAYGNDNLLCIADNPVDACYEMILKLYELKLL